MLHVLRITDYALIDRLELSLAPGFNVLTGETGAGKSIVVDAIGLLIGKRADVGLIRAEAQQARVEGVFALDGDDADAARAVLEDAGIALDQGEEIVVARELNHQGRNVCRVNGAIVPLRVLAALGERLADIHGQNQQLPLLNPRTHAGILDRFAGLAPLAGGVADAVGRLRAVRAALAAQRGGEREQAQRADLLRYQTNEIDAAQLRPGEDDALEADRTVAANAERLQELAARAHESLYEGDGPATAAVDALSAADQAIAALAQIDPAMAALRDDAQALVIGAQELARAVADYRDGINVDPGRLDGIEERLAVLRALKHKYGNTIDDVLRHGELAARELAGIGESGERAAALEAEEREQLGRVGALAGELSLRRQEASVRLSEAVQAELGELAMGDAAFHVDVTQTPADGGAPVAPSPIAQTPLAQTGDAAAATYAFDATGIDRVEFLLSPGPGEPLRPLASTASGGETSRIMLAIKGVLAAGDGPPTLIFDEVDAGIGGRVGAVVGAKTWRLSSRHQVLCVTHLPQIAAFADQHVRIEKAPAGGRTVTTAAALTPAGAVEELAHMLGAVGQSARRHAQEMLARTAAWKGAGAADAPAGQPLLAGLADALEVDTPKPTG